MMPGKLQRRVRIRRENDARFLIQRLFHGCFDGAREIGSLTEPRAVRHCFYMNVIALAEA